MDFTLLPKKALKRRFFSRFTTGSSSIQPAKDIDAPARSGFYYIGKNARNIDLLVKVFKRGYASQLIDNAIVELKRSLDQEGNLLPYIIICEDNFDATAMDRFSNFLKNDPALSAVAFIRDVAELSEMQLRKYIY